MSVDGLSWAIRTLGLVALYQAAGAALFLWLMGRRLDAALPSLRRLTAGVALIALPLSIAHGSLEAARMADEFGGLADPALLRLAWFSPGGAAHAAQCIGLLALLAALPGAGQAASRRLAAAAGLVAALGLVLTGHGRVVAHRALFLPLLATHLAVVAFWFGSLWPLLQVLRHEAAPVAAQVVERFSMFATRSVPLILVAGLGMAWILLPDASVLSRPYGHLLLAKIAGYALLMPLAAWNKWRLTPSLQANEAGAGTVMRRVVLAEYALMLAVLAVTAQLTGFYSPEG